MCKDYTSINLTSQHACYKECLTEKVEQAFQKYPFSVITGERLDIGHIVDNDLQNDSTSTQLTALEDACSAECSQPDCSDEYTLTKVMAAIDQR